MSAQHKRPGAKAKNERKTKADNRAKLRIILKATAKKVQPSGQGEN